jgi:hypothetical protein
MKIINLLDLIRFDILKNRKTFLKAGAHLGHHELRVIIGGIEFGHAHPGEVGLISQLLLAVNHQFLYLPQLLYIILDKFLLFGSDPPLTALVL